MVGDCLAGGEDFFERRLADAQRGRVGIGQERVEDERLDAVRAKALCDESSDASASEEADPAVEVAGEGGEEALVNKRKPGNPLAKYVNKKNLTPMEQLEYKVAKLERELLKKEAEIVRLKKLNEQERGDAKRK